jgi:membrane protease YdiL (CAAX protease family)
MNQTPPEVITATLIFIALWMIIVLVILVAGRYYPALGRFRARMMSKWKPALAIAGLYILSTGLGGRGILNPYGLAIFCQALIGLTIASSIEGFKPFPVADALIRRQNIVRQVALMLVISILAVVPALLIGTIGLDIGRHIFGEANYTQQAASTITTLAPNKWMVFFLLLAGAGIAEETTYRLVCLSIIWKLTRRKWLVILISALLFGAYHLTPLSGMYLTNWQFPISQFIASTLIGLVWGYLFVKRGLETAVIGHTLSDWLPMMLFMR